MSSFTLSKLPRLLQVTDINTATKVMTVVDKKYEEGIDSYNQFVDMCRTSTPDAYPSYLD